MPDPTFRRIVLIGLGGSGQQIVLHLKRLFLDQHKRVPPSVKLLCLDTDGAPMDVRSNLTDRVYRLDPQEFLHIKVAQPEVFIRETSAVQKWFVKPIPVGAITAGAGAVRQNGRLALFFNLEAIQGRIDAIQTQLSAATLHTEMQDARFGLSPMGTEVYVCGSLAGGTGSGTFLDLGILLRRKMPQALIHGFFLLDWLYRRNAFSHRVGGNVYAALAELDNLQSVMYGTTSFVPYEVDYGRFQARVENAPYTLVHLVDGRNEDGENISEARQVYDVVASAIYLSVGDLGNRVASVVDNVMTQVNVGSPRTWDGKFARYSSFGVSSIVYPAKALLARSASAQALALCQQAIAELKGQSTGAQDARALSDIGSNVDQLLQTLSLKGEGVPVLQTILQAVEPCLTPVAFEPPLPYELSEGSFPSALRARLQSEEEAQIKAVQEAFKSHSAGVLDKAKEALGSRLTQLMADRSVTAVYRQQWIQTAIERLTALQQVAANDLTQANNKLAEIRAEAEAHLRKAADLPHRSLFGSPRKDPASRWHKAINNGFFEAVRRTCLLDLGGELLRSLIGLLKERLGPTAVGVSDIEKALEAAEKQLRVRARDADDEITALLKKPNHVFVGRGACVVRKELGKDLEAAGEAHRDDEGSLVIHLTLQRFKEKKNIRVADDYLRLAAEADVGLAGLFRAYAEERLAKLGEVPVKEAMAHFSAKRGRDEIENLREQFGHLFRLASPLWKYSRSHINATRSPHYQKIIVVGVKEEQEGEEAYGQAINDAKAQFGIATGHTFARTGSEEQIWLLAYAAALPAYFVETLRENRQQYDEEISPPYHLDRVFETTVPDIFPTTSEENIALRVLGLAIVPGLNIVKDSKLTKGHMFTCDSPEAQALNGGAPWTWGLFRDMHACVCRTDVLRELLASQLRERFDQNSPKGKSREDGDPLRRGDLEQAGAIVGDMLAGASDSRPRWLFSHFSPEGKKALQAYDGRVALSDELKGVLLAELNALVTGGSCLYADMTQAGDAWSEDTAQLLKKHQTQALAGKELVKLNRLLLQESFLREGITPSLMSLRTAIESYIRKVKTKLERRDFSRLVSARLTYREIKALEDFISTGGQGLRMDIGRYISGN